MTLFQVHKNPTRRDIVRSAILDHSPSGAARYAMARSSRNRNAMPRRPPGQQLFDIEVPGEQLEIRLPEEPEEQLLPAPHQAILGLVTPQAIVRTWSKNDSQDWVLTDPDGLRSFLGKGRIAREVEVPSASFEVASVDAAAGQIVLTLSDSPGSDGPSRSTRTFRARPIDTAELSWADCPRPPLKSWLTTVIDIAGQRGETVQISERGLDGSGQRVVQVGYRRLGRRWSARVATNDRPDTALWSDAEVLRQGAEVHRPVSESSAEDLALLALDAITEWKQGPLGLVLSWAPTDDGPLARDGLFT